MSVKYVLLYESAEDVLTKAPEHFPAHSARGQAFHERGSLVAYGPFGDPQEQGSRPSLFSWPYDCDLPPGPLGPMGCSVGASGSSFRPENEHHDMPWFWST